MTLIKTEYNSDVKRRGFLRSVGAAASAALVIPAVAAASPKTEPAPAPEPAPLPMTDAEWDDLPLEYERDEMLLERIRASPWYQATVLSMAVQERDRLRFPAPNITQPELISRACNFPRYAAITPAPLQSP